MASLWAVPIRHVDSELPDLSFLLLAWIGLASTFFIFAAIGLFGAIFGIKCVPETRNRSLEQIEHDLKGWLDDENRHTANHAVFVSKSR